MSRTIVHLDADAFFASVEQATDTLLWGKSVAVGGESRGIVKSSGEAAAVSRSSALDTLFRKPAGNSACQSKTLKRGQPVRRLSGTKPPGV